MKTWVIKTWVPFWSNLIVIWYHYAVIFTLVTISNWWLSSIDMKLRLLIKEAFVVFQWLMFRIILICLLSNVHRALFWYNRQLENNYTYLAYFYIYIYIYIYRKYRWFNYCIKITAAASNVIITRYYFFPQIVALI